MARKSFAFALLMTVAFGLLASAAQAATITAGQTLFASGEAGPVGGSLVASNSAPLVAVTFTGILHSEVWSGDISNPYEGGLTFVYWIDNTNGPTGNSLSRFTTSNFTGFQTDVSYDPTNGRAPTLVDRGASGDVMGYSFLGDPQLGFGNGKIAPGETSAKLVIQTDATDWKTTLGFVINGSTASASTFAPTAVVPEPSSLALAAMGIAGAIGFAVRRRKA